MSRQLLNPMQRRGGPWSRGPHEWQLSHPSFPHVLEVAVVPLYWNMFVLRTGYEAAGLPTRDRRRSWLYSAELLFFWKLYGLGERGLPLVSGALQRWKSTQPHTFNSMRWGQFELSWEHTKKTFRPSNVTARNQNQLKMSSSTDDLMPQGCLVSLWELSLSDREIPTGFWSGLARFR